MGKKGGWFSSIKRTLSPSSKKRQKSLEEHHAVPDTPNLENAGGSCDSHSFLPPVDVKPIVVENEQPQHTYSVADASVATTSTAVTATTSRYSGKSKEELAATRIQTAFRGYLARRALWGLRGLVRLKAVVEGTNVKRQTANTLKCAKSLSHLQSQINSRRIRMSEENQALQKQLIRAKELENMQNGDEWNDSVQSKEEMEAKLLNKYEATMRRERAMAYSFSHQQPWKKSTGTTNMLFMDPTNPQWGWSWSERYVPRGEKDSGNDQTSNKSGINITRSEIAKSYARHQLNSAPSTPRSKAGGPVASRKPKPNPSPQAHGSGLEANLDDDSKSVVSVQSERNRRHSVGGSMVKNGESLPSSPAARKRMVLAKSSAKAKPREEGLSESGDDGRNTAVGSGGNVKKQLTYPKRHSGPPKVE
uniref:protein IQ-DOMAIN 2-like n=1 Tax=Erigeron canadensis TaxID=72917 RepID=UPI001CB9697E|nr:protein IQ-DOMAIN 2-like [Erigeron canadensis]